MAIADSELVLEGYVDPRDRRFETKESEDAGVQGRFHFHPEWAGYMGKAYKAPTFHVTGITMRRPAVKPIIFALGVHTLDDHNIDTTVREAAIFELCHRLQPGIVQNVVIPYCMTDWGGCIIQVKKRHQIDEGWQRNFLAAALSCSQGMRLAIAVSEDVDPYSMDDVMWCLTTRVNPRADILNPIPGRPRPDFHAGRADDRGREAVDRVEHAVRGRHGDRCDGAVRLRERFPAAGLSGGQGQAGGFLHQEGHRERPIAHDRLGALALALRPLRRAVTTAMLLSDVLIVDMTDRLGWLAGRVLADLGAEVVKIEPPGSERSRPHWRAFNVNKRVLELDPAGMGDRS